MTALLEPTAPDYTGMTVADVARLLDVPLRDAMELMGADYLCSDCGKPADLWDDKASTEVGSCGDRDVPFWSTPCCRAEFIDRSGNAYNGDCPWRED